MRGNQIDRNSPIPDSKSRKKKPRGFLASAKNVNDDSILVRWKDSIVVTMASTVHGVQPVSKIRRYSRKVKRSVSVDCPHMDKMYNKFMEGTDKMDQNYNAYRMGIRAKKWRWSIFTW